MAFFAAYNQDDKLKIFMSTEFATNDNGIIIELLKDIIVYPKSPMVDTDFDETVSYQ
ncbi:hypothetical protein APHAL10511_005561 [Amanita phalloides]|nr:hypothetical protein APHAL10511_005561 [Amanita phalloides]